ncbi:MAG TPA: D-amino acid aminotransferase, partial [Chromatiales bacterium]|nr:D-amino acid aminotransferase [Chromatiales bacterium]
IAAVRLEDLRWGRCDIKAVTLLANVLARREAARRGAAEAILVRDGLVTEGAASNVFAVLDGTVVTPPKGPHILPGITRDVALELARAEGLATREAELPAAALDRAEEIWISSSTRELVPVTRLDGRPVGGGRPGPVWRRLDAAYQALKARHRAGA